MTPEQIEAKLSEIESDMERMIAENTRLIKEREGVYVELDMCVGLMAKLALKCGFNAGTAPGNTVAIELPSGQVTFEYGAEEAHLFKNLSPYEKPIEDISVQEKFARVMNPNLN